jgi:hypothetical protein
MTISGPRCLRSKHAAPPLFLLASLQLATLGARKDSGEYCGQSNSKTGTSTGAAVGVIFSVTSGGLRLAPSRRRIRCSDQPIRQQTLTDLGYCALCPLTQYRKIKEKFTAIAHSAAAGILRRYADMSSMDPPRMAPLRRSAASKPSPSFRQLKSIRHPARQSLEGRSLLSRFL